MESFGISFRQPTSYVGRLVSDHLLIKDRPMRRIKNTSRAMNTALIIKTSVVRPMRKASESVKFVAGGNTRKPAGSLKLGALVDAIGNTCKSDLSAKRRIGSVGNSNRKQVDIPLTQQAPIACGWGLTLITAS
jgi:hypothetical protein